MKNPYNRTKYACFIGYIVQAIINNFLPLLFLTIQKDYNISLSKISLLITVNFAFQLTVDVLSITFVDRIGYKASMFTAHILACIGLASLGFLPEILPDPFAAFLISICLYGMGGGLLEVLVSPAMERCPADNKEAAMSLLHSFYCWGQVGVVLLSTLFFWIAGIDNWKVLAIVWACIPLLNAFYLLQAPFESADGEPPASMSLKELGASKIFRILIVMMFCAGASELAVSQWASAFAEKGLGINKTVGDLAGPMAFAVLMGLSRVFYGKYGDRIKLDHFMTFSSILCITSYLCISLVPNPVIGLIGCAVCGLSVGIMWPGTFSTGSAVLKGGTSMFALLALAGDLGCMSGPTMVGNISGLFGDNLKIGILFGGIFPLLLIIEILRLRRRTRKPVIGNHSSSSD